MSAKRTTDDEEPRRKRMKHTITASNGDVINCPDKELAFGVRPSYEELRRQLDNVISTPDFSKQQVHDDFYPAIDNILRYSDKIPSENVSLYEEPQVNIAMKIVLHYLINPFPVNATTVQQLHDDICDEYKLEKNKFLTTDDIDAIGSLAKHHLATIRLNCEIEGEHTWETKGVPFIKNLLAARLTDRFVEPKYACPIRSDDRKLCANYGNDYLIKGLQPPKQS